MAELRTPIISTIMGEGGSGGALAIAVADDTMLIDDLVTIGEALLMFL